MDFERDLDLNLLKFVNALHDAGSASEAAKLIGVSQPSVSTALAKLRRHFNDPLFVRSARGMSPTPRGLEVINVAKSVLRQVEDGLRSEMTFDPARPQRPFTFALSDVGEIVFLPRLIQALAQQSQTVIRCVTMRPPALVQALEGGLVDLAIGYFPDLKSADFFQQLLFNHHFVCLLRHDHSVRGNRLTMSEFLSLQHAVVHSEGRSQEILENYLESRGVVRRVVLSTPHFLSIPKIIANSDLVVTVPHAMGIAYGHAAYGLKVINPPFESPRIELRQHWHRKFHKDARNAWLRKVVSTLFNAATDEWGRSTAASDGYEPPADRAGPDPDGPCAGVATHEAQDHR